MLGESLGTAVAVDLAIHHHCAAVILESALMSAGKVAGTMLAFLGPLLVHGYDTYSKISRVQVPLLVIHCDADEIAVLARGNVFRAANEPKEFWRVSSVHHNDLLDVAGTAYVARLQSFYRRVVRK